ncbi:hypothetical protein ACFO3O_06180 [Dokdonia ponticola]|uniref:Uncharacterized protein n=1 Tax=Dokdonia ponticola TaxID=2041041 RepID=A0ABV9HWU3_9FLAO
MIKNLVLWRTRIFLFLTAMALFICCQKDDDGSFPLLEAHQHEQLQTTTTIVSLDEIPKVADYLSTLGDHRGHFTIEKSIIANNRSNEPNLVIGTLQTSEIIQVTDQYDRKNHTFLLTSIENTDTTVTSTFNLIVQESSSGLFSYIVEYRPDEGWIPNYRDTQDFSTFSGEIIHYSIAGRYIAKLSLIDGVTISGETRSPCSDDGDPDGDTGNNGGNDGNPGPGDSGPGDGDGGGNEDNPPPDPDVSADLKWLCVWRQFLHNEPSECNNPSLGGSWVIVITYGDKSVEDTVRCPDDLPELPEVCYDNNGDPCPNQCDPNGNGCAEEPNPNVGIFFDIECTLENNEMNVNSPFNVDFSFINPCTVGTITTPQDEKLLCIYSKITDTPLFKQFFVNTFGESDVLNVTFKVVDQFPNSTHPNANGVTVANSVERNIQTGEITSMNVEIFIRKSYMELNSNIAVAKTIIHESIHAYLLVHYLGCNQAIDIEGLNNLDFGNLINEYYGSACPNQEQHEFMFEYMIPAMQEILSDVRDNFVPQTHQSAAESQNHFMDENNPSGDTVPWDWNQFYFYLSLAGLHETNGYMNNIENSPAKLFNYQQYVQIGQSSFSKTYCED